MLLRDRLIAIVVVLLTGATALAQQGTIAGTVRDQTGAPLPGVTVELTPAHGTTLAAATDVSGRYRFDGVAAGSYALSFRLLNFADQRRDVQVGTAPVTIDAVMALALSADVIVTAKRTFANLADVENPAENLVGIAQAASQGAITARQLDVRPLMREGEVLETVPGVIITQHSGEGKANQYFLRGFNLDHGSDFAMTVAGTPVNMPSHAHSQGYSDLNFLIPELVARVQFSKGPYFAEQGEFATAGASNINYATELDHPIVHAEAGAYGFGRALFAASPRLGKGHLLAAVEASTNDGPWTVPDAFHKLNGVLRYTQGDSVNGVSINAMGYHGRWNATEASPERAVAAGVLDRFGSIDPTDGGRSSRYSLGFDWQRGSNAALTTVTAFGLAYGLDLISNFTFYLDDPVHGDQIEQVDHRFVTGARVSQRRLGQWYGHAVQNTIGVQLRNDRIPQVALYHTEKQVRLEMRSNADVTVTSGGVYAQNEIEWAPWLRMTTGLRADASHYRVSTLDAANSGTANAAILSPKAGAVIGPWKGTEFYVNGGTGFHSNNALGTTVTRGANGNAVDRVTPLVRANGRRGRRPHRRDSSRADHRVAVDASARIGAGLRRRPRRDRARAGERAPRDRDRELLQPLQVAGVDADLSLSRARFVDGVDGQAFVPEAVGTVVSAGASVDGYRRTFASIRWRYFGPRALVSDDSVRSQATSLVNLQAGYQVARRLRLTADVFNLFNAKMSDIDYYFASRLPGEPLGGVEDIHFHPAVPRTVRVSLVVGL